MKNLRIILVGGGTGGSVAPLLAMAEKIKEKNKNSQFLFVAPGGGKIEKELIKDYNFKFQTIFCGKLRRYFSWRNFIDPFLIILGFFQSIFLLVKFSPDLIIGAGGYVSVPMVLASWFLKIPSVIHQQDVIPSLSNKILSFFAQKITVSLEVSLKDFPRRKTVLTGNPVREIIFKGNKERLVKELNLESNLPVLLVLGGGTGSQKINQLTWEAAPELIKFCQIIHLTGKGKAQATNGIKQIANRYHHYEFLTNEIADVYAAADLVISRAGINVLSELAVLGKATIIIPIPDTHQEANANYFENKKAALVLDQKKLTPQQLIATVKKILTNEELKNKFQENIKRIINKGTGEKIVDEIFKLNLWT